MDQTILKSIRVPQSVATKIQTWAKQLGISQGELIKKMSVAYAWLLADQEYERQIQEMSQDASYLKEQVDLANSNFE